MSLRLAFPTAKFGGGGGEVAYFQNAHVSQCVGDFEYDINCGTYIEVMLGDRWVVMLGGYAGFCMQL